MATKQEQDLDLIKRAKDCLEIYEDFNSDNIRRAQEAIRFRAGEQWPEDIRRERENQNQDGGPRPCPVMDKLNQYIRQVVNEERQNRAAIRIRPVDDDADPDTAEIFNGLIRHIEDQSEALEAYSTAGEHAIDGGFGYLRILAEYCDPMSFDQDIRIKKIPNRFSVALGYHTEVDGSDAEEGLIWEDISKEEFKEKYPNASINDFDAGDKWADDKLIRVVEYYYIDNVKTKIHLMDNGQVITDEQLRNVVKAIEEYNAIPENQPVMLPEPQDSRDTVIKQVKWCKLTAHEILERRDIPGPYIPIIKVTGNEIVMPDGKSRLSGMVEDAMDSQRLYNYSIAGFIEDVALAPRAHWIAEESQVEGYEQEYADANRYPISLLKYKATNSENGQPLPPPQRVPKAGLDSGWQQMLMNIEHSIAASVGMMAPNMMEAAQGLRLPQMSGIALERQESKGMITNYHFPDNLARSIQQVGRILLEWIPKYYDTERVIRIIGEDGKESKAKLNPQQPQSVVPEYDEFEQKEIGKIYNLNVGTYDVTVSTGPSYSAKRQEAVDQQLKVIDARPEMLSLIGDIVFNNMDAPGSEEIAERLKVMLPAEVKQMIASEEAGQDPAVAAMMSQVEQAAQQIEAKAQELAAAEQEINNQARDVKSDKVAVEAARKDLDSQRKVFAAEVKQKQAELRYEAGKLMNTIFSEKIKGKGDEKDELKERELDQKDVHFDREMRLKEMSAGVVENPAIEKMNEILTQISYVQELAKKGKKAPKFEYDSNGNISAVNGRKVIRDLQGKIASIGEEPEEMGESE